MTLGLDLDFGRLPALERTERWPGTPREDAGAERGPRGKGRRGAQALWAGDAYRGRARRGGDAARPLPRRRRRRDRQPARGLARLDPAAPGAGVRAALWAIELAPAVPAQAAVGAAARGADGGAPRLRAEPGATLRSLLRAALTPLRFVHYDRPEMFKHVGCRYELPTVRDEAPRWLAQVTDGREVEEDLELECEVLVIGTGAGGAAAAYELASRGHAVLMLEEGDFHRRSSFTGRPARAYREMYRDHGLDMTLGNVNIPVFAGRAVGGSTVINSGTCYRAPESTFASWRDGMGLPAEFSSSGLAPYYERVERMLQVAPADPLHLGAIGPIVRRGAERPGPAARAAPAQRAGLRWPGDLLLRLPHGGQALDRRELRARGAEAGRAAHHGGAGQDDRTRGGPRARGDRGARRRHEGQRQRRPRGERRRAGRRGSWSGRRPSS